MIKNKNPLFILFLILQMVGCAQVKDTSKNEVELIFNKWQQATYKSLNDSLNEIIKSGADSLSVVKNTLPIFQNHITSSRSECFNSYNEKRYNPFDNLYSSNLLVIEIFREDNCHTKVMHIIDEKVKKKYSFVRSCMTDNKTEVYEETVSDNLSKSVEGFVSDFSYKEGWRAYTGVITYITKGNFKSVPLLYLSDDDIEKLNAYGVGLE
ncbi:MAG: hypothetical protein IPG60_01595 [Bacteroidetes bacterium]|nr:hypothetical protein [Bacteroidota bacterium]MBP7400279.1 hypothetical protein [Chitinophagales bacterium]MBP9190647.1 hypothetical protein [Chitinophagales bacterium]MBP9549001.1 hypothetical protein [Chitinophagales bacterium]MBP9705578.1 hypothetical protein [Chitinophagales bacterium]